MLGDINALNDRCKHLFNIIQKQGPVTKNQLIDITKMKLSTLNRSIQFLIDNRIIIETSIAKSTGGRKPVLLDVNPIDFYAIGIDISRTYIRAVITNLKINIVAEKCILGSNNLDELNLIIPKCIEELILESNINKSLIIGIGVSIVGPADNRALYEGIIRKEISIPIFVDNGANAAVIAEYYFGAGKNKENIVYINCGVGIRTGVISSGTLIRTINNSEDAFGHMIVDVDGELCWCGNYGCVESYASINKITKKFISEIKKGKRLSLNKDLEEIDYIDICNLAEEKNEIAINTIVDATIHFGTGLANYIKLFNPQLVILSGPLIKHSLLFYETCKDIALKRCHFGDDIKIEFSREGYFEDKSMAVGAAVMVIEELFKI